MSFECWSSHMDDHECNYWRQWFCYPVSSIGKMRSAFPLWLRVSAFKGVLCDCVLCCLRLCHKAPPRFAAVFANILLIRIEQHCAYIAWSSIARRRWWRKPLLVKNSTGSTNGKIWAQKCCFAGSTWLLWILYLGCNSHTPTVTQSLYSMLSLFTMCYIHILQKVQVQKASFWDMNYVLYSMQKYSACSPS